MTDLSQFSASESELLISLPYRVGIFISNADDVEGESDDKHEMQMLEETLKAISKLARAPLVAQIFKETLRLKFEWKRWYEKSFDVSADARSAISLLISKADEDTAKAYRAALMEVASTVAQAAGEFEQFDEIEEGGGLFSGLVSKIVSGFSNLSDDDLNHPMNVSASEDGALSTLSAALKI
jgi:hypothetical protein